VTLILKNLLFTVLVPGTVVVYVPLQIVAGRSPGSGVVPALGVALLVLGATVYAWCVWDFAAFGRGTPAPIDAPKKLVIRGLYRYTRNPMYLGVLTVVLGWAALFRSADVLLYALAVWTCFHGFTVLYEERRLATLFGDSYRAYCSRVGRWLPRPPRPPEEDA
jgi:protein-S-isoprenylcysteine O-methyltransferase Ste14